MEKHLDLLDIFKDPGVTPSLLDFVSFLADDYFTKEKEKALYEKLNSLDRQIGSEVTDYSCSIIEAAFNVGFLYGNMFDITDPEPKAQLEALKKKMIDDGTLMFVPREKNAA